MVKKGTSLQGSMSTFKPIDIVGINADFNQEPDKYVDYYLKKAKLLNGFFQVNRIREHHEDLQIIAMYIAVQMAMGIIRKSDIEDIKEEIYKIAEALEPRFKDEKAME